VSTGLKEPAPKIYASIRYPVRVLLVKTRSPLADPAICGDTFEIAKVAVKKGVG